MGIFSKNGIIKPDGAASSIRQAAIEELVVLASEGTRGKVSESIPETSENGVKDNCFFISQRLQTAYVRLKTRLSVVDTRFDPEMYVAGVTIALAYIENESRLFSDFAFFMLGSFGELVKPHLLSFYVGVCNVPDTAVSGLTSYEECLKEYSALMQTRV